MAIEKVYQDSGNPGDSDVVFWKGVRESPGSGIDREV